MMRVQLVIRICEYDSKSPGSFQRLRRMVWTDQEYYDESFAENRMRLALSVTERVYAYVFDVSDIRDALTQDGRLSQAKLDLSFQSHIGETLVSAVIRVIGVLEGIRPTEEWYDLL